MFNTALIKQLAAEVGFSDCGIARADALTEEEYPLDAWLAAGYQADMQYMERNVAMRRDPRLLVEGARSVISLVLAYKPDRQMEGTPRIAQYAYGEDYHERLKRMMYQLIAEIKEQYPDFEGRPFVDTAPISDRHWAVRAGLGWIGRNTLFVHPRFGSYCFLSEIVTTAEIDNSKFKIGNSKLDCADCRLCVDACPNQAIVTPLLRRPPLEGGAALRRGLSNCPSDSNPGQNTKYKIQNLLDARRCTSYNTIENRADALPESLNTQGYAFGCDICQLVCPYNQNAPAAETLPDDRKAQLEALPDADEATFRRFSKHSAISHISYSQWQRNIQKAK